MTRTMRRVTGSLVGAVLALGALIGPASSTQASPLLPTAAPDCVGSGKVWVQVVTDTGASLSGQCLTSPATGLAALSGIGYQQENSGLVCEVGGYPKDRCATGWDGRYWSYWTATPGGSWTYSTVGPGSRKPPAGSLDGWCYTPAGSQSSQAAACRNLLTSAVNPATVAPTTAPTTRPSTTPPRTSAPPTSVRPSVAPTATATRTTAPRTSGPRTSAARSTAPRTATVAGSAPTSRATTTTPPATPTHSSPTPSSPTPSSSVTPISSTPSSPTPVNSISPTHYSSASTTAVAVIDSEGGAPWGVISTVGIIALGACAVGGWRWRQARKH